MKKVLLATVLALATTSLFAQSQQGGEQQLIAKAKKAARDAGCLDNYNGAIDAQVSTVSICFVDGFVTEVLLTPNCNGPECQYVKFAPIAKVTFYCTDENPVVECLQ